MSEQDKASCLEVLTSAGPVSEAQTNGQGFVSEHPTEQTPHPTSTVPTTQARSVRSIFPPPHAGQVERRLPLEAQASIIQEPLQSTLAREADPANRLYPNVDPRCPHARGHNIGHFCHECRGMPMPWGAELPRVTDDLGHDITGGPPGSLFSGVALRNSNAIATLSTLVYLSLTNQPRMSVDGVNGFEARYVATAAAARQVVRLINSLRLRAMNGDQVPEFYDIIHRALTDQDLSYDAHRNNILRTFGRENPRQHGCGNLRHGLGVGMGSMADRVARDSELTASRDNGSGSANTGGPGSTPTDDDLSGELVFEERPDVRGTKGC